MSIELPRPLKCRRCGVRPQLDTCDNSDPLDDRYLWRVHCTNCGAIAEGFSATEAINEWNRVHDEELTEPVVEKIATEAVNDIESILRAAEGRYTFICRFCAHWKTKDCCDKDGKCNPEWRGVKEMEE